MGCRFFSDCNKCNEAARAIKEDCQAQTDNKRLREALEDNKKGLQWAIDNYQHGIRGALGEMYQTVAETLKDKE